MSLSPAYQPPAPQRPVQNPGTSQLQLTNYSDIPPRKVSWLWENRIPLGKITILAGNPGLGKSFISCDLAARVSRGGRFPDGSVAPQGRVLMLNVEDGPSDTIQPRLVKHGANLDLVVHVGDVGEGIPFTFDRHMSVLRDAFEAFGDVKLLVVDPLSACLGNVDSNKNAEVRRVLSPLSKIADDYGVAVVAVEHLNKNSQSQSVYRVQGSIGFVGAARSVWGVVKDPRDPEYRIMQVIKQNLAKDTGETGLRYRIEDGRVNWDEKPVDYSLDDLALGKVKGDALGNSLAWLEDHLVEPILAKDVSRAASAAGIAEKTLERAKAEAGVKSAQTKAGWYWLPSGFETLAGWQEENPQWNGPT